MKKWLFIALASLTVLSCKMVNRLGDTANELFKGEVVARAGEHRLHRSQLESYIPSGVSSEDSARLAQQYIRAWAEDLLLLDMADEQLSKEEKDVTEELESYRRALLKYRYEQLYINQRLDTLVTEEEVEAYYQANPDKFILDRPVVKARYMIIPADSRNLKELRRLMSSEDDSDIMEAENLAYTAAIKYGDSSDSWKDIITLAQELGTDYKSLLGAIKNQFAELPDEAGNLRIAYIVDMVPQGKTAPEEFCAERIRDIILNTRKHSLTTQLEQDLLEDARRNNKFVIY
ncbi:MAG: hypothetical protein J5519_05195 [Bacteroidales bacterium]|nr:hypothetical protein [Bacteroidales bacterium]